MLVHSHSDNPYFHHVPRLVAGQWSLGCRQAGRWPEKTFPAKWKKGLLPRLHPVVEEHLPWLHPIVKGRLPWIHTVVDELLLWLQLGVDERLPWLQSLWRYFYHDSIPLTRSVLALLNSHGEHLVASQQCPGVGVLRLLPAACQAALMSQKPLLKLPWHCTDICPFYWSHGWCSFQWQSCGMPQWRAFAKTVNGIRSVL